MKLLLATMMIMTSVLFGVKMAGEYVHNEEVKGTSSSPAPTVKFVLKYSNGDVMLFEGENVIETFSEVNYSLLPPIDQESLSNGIEFDNLEDAYQLIEDFDG